MMGTGMMGGMGVWMFAFPFFALLLFATLLVVGVWSARAFAAEEDDATTEVEPEETPIERLQRRYTEGELTEAAFERELERELEREDADGIRSPSTDESDRAHETERTG